MIGSPYSYYWANAKLRRLGAAIIPYGFSPFSAIMQELALPMAQNIDLNLLKPPTITPNHEPFVSTVTFTLANISGISGAQIRYTTNGNAPTTSSTLYSTPFTVTGVLTVTVKAILCDSTGHVSGIATRTVVADTAVAPTISPDGGAFETSVEVTLSSTTPGAVIKYTTDGSAPSGGTTYTTPITLTESCTLKTQTFATGYSSSAVVSADFTISSGE